MTTDPKEAAEQRLAEAFLNLYRHPYMLAFDAEGQIEWLHFARIAIEQGVVPAVLEAKGQMMEFCVGRSLPVPGFPWAAVCKEKP